MTRWIPILMSALCLVSGARAADESHVLIGATLPLSGADASAARAYQKGYELAVEEVNAQGGIAIDGRRRLVSLIVRDDGGVPASAASELTYLVHGIKVQAILGSYGTPLIQAQAPVAERMRIPFVNGGSSASDVYQQSMRFVFGTMSPIKMLAYAEIGWIEEQQKAGRLPVPTRIAMVWEDTAQGRDFRSGIVGLSQRASSAVAYKIVLDAPFALNTTDFHPLLSRVKALDADVFLVDAKLSDFIAMHRQYVAEGLCHRLVSYGPRGSETAAAEALGREHVASLVSAVWWSPQLAKDPANRAFVARFLKRFGQEPEWYHTLSYETARALLTAIDHAQSLRPDKIRVALEQLHMDSILPGGQINFPAAYGNQSHYPLLVVQNQKDGSAPIIYPPYLATGHGTVENVCHLTRADTARQDALAVRN